jgi:hypothetical protein
MHSRHSFVHDSDVCLKYQNNIKQNVSLRSMENDIINVHTAVYCIYTNNIYDS